MSALLRASGARFDVDRFVADCKLRIAKVYHCGDARPRPPKGRTHKGKTLEKAGLNIVVSEAGFHEFRAQVADAIAFLLSHDAEVRRLVDFPGVTGVVLDFAVAWRDVVAQSDKLPTELVRLAGACGIALMLSHYPVSGSDLGRRKTKTGRGP